MGFFADIVKVIVDWLKPQVTLERIQLFWGNPFHIRQKIRENCLWQCTGTIRCMRAESDSLMGFGSKWRRNRAML